MLVALFMLFDPHLHVIGPSIFQYVADTRALLVVCLLYMIYTCSLDVSAIRGVVAFAMIVSCAFADACLMHFRCLVDACGPLMR